ncbi:MAG: arginine--tRNA ligase, partial [Clostridia bacterium]|nr:arginine--tRNA ligase [Clostridia bacterium]
MSLLVKQAKEQIVAAVRAAAEKAMEKGLFDRAELPEFSVDTPSNRDHGDYAVNAAMVWARALHKAPRMIAETLMAEAELNGTYIDR